MSDPRTDHVRTEHPIIVIDDHPLLGAGLVAELSRSGLSAEQAELRPPDELIERVVACDPIGVVLDLGIPIEGGGLTLVGPFARHGIPVTVLTGETEIALLASCIAEGAEVVLAKSEPMVDIIEAIGKVCAGEPVKPQQRMTLAEESRRLADAEAKRFAPFAALSPREGQVLAGLMDGLGPGELAERDFVSVQTVRSQVKSILRKLDVRSQLEAVARANRAGWRLPREAAGKA